MNIKFDIINKIGEGSFGSVFKVNRKLDNSTYAVKKVHTPQQVKISTLKQKQRENALNQIRILASINHPNVISYKQAFYDQNEKSLCFVMEYAQKGDLSNLIEYHKKNNQKIAQEQIWKTIQNVTSGLKSLHQKNILHRDIKCANILIDGNGSYKLGDLNVSKVLKAKLAFTQTGTPYYASPQVWGDKPYDIKSDIWSLGIYVLKGCILYQMAALKPPFMAKTMSQLYQKVKKGTFRRIPSLYSEQLQSKIANMIKVDPSKRPTCNQILLDSKFGMKNNQVFIKRRQKNEVSTSLLQTIKLPKNLRQLKQILPKSNYYNQQIATDQADGQTMKFYKLFPPMKSTRNRNKASCIEKGLQQLSSCNKVPIKLSTQNDQQKLVKSRQRRQLKLLPQLKNIHSVKNIQSINKRNVLQLQLKKQRIPSTEKMQALSPISCLKQKKINEGKKVKKSENNQKQSYQYLLNGSNKSIIQHSQKLIQKCHKRPQWWG